MLQYFSFWNSQFTPEKLRHRVIEMYFLLVVCIKYCLDEKLKNPNSQGKIFFLLDSYSSLKY